MNLKCLECQGEKKHKGQSTTQAKSFSLLFLFACLLFLFLFFETGFLFVALCVLELCRHQTGLKLTENCLPVPPENWDKRHVPPPPGFNWGF